MDVVAEIAIDLIVSQASLPSVINVAHPRPVSWHVAFSAINRCLDKPLPFIPLREWSERLDVMSAAPEATDLERVVSSALVRLYALRNDITPDSPLSS